MDHSLTLSAIVLLSLINSKLISSQPIQITNLVLNPGLLTLQNSNSYLKIGSHQLFHVINLQNYEPIFRKLEININGINYLGNHSEMTDLLQTKLSNTLHLFSELQPRTRTKRGLFNFIGSGIKTITGNLDNHDLIKISKTLQDLSINSNLLINENNEQRQINKQFQDRINRIIKQLEKQQIQISKNLILAKNDNARKEFVLLKEIFKIHFNLDYLKSHLDDIFEAIQLAKLQLLSKNILSSSELDFATRKLEEKGVIIENLEEIYDFLEVSAFHNGSRIIFVISIPLLENNTYENFIIEPLPVGNKILKIKSTHAMKSNSSTYLVVRDCKRIHKHRLCDRDNLEDITNDDCISNLLQGQSANCTFTQCMNPTEIKLITKNLIVLKAVKSLEINSTCGITDRNLTGSYLIEFHNCTIYLNGSAYENAELTFTEYPIMLPLDGLSITENDYTPVLQIEEINIHNRKFLENFTKNHQIGTYSSITVSTVSLVIIIIITATIARKTIFRKFNPFLKKHQHHVDHEVHKIQTPRDDGKTNRDDSFSKGGVVNKRSSKQTEELALRVLQIQQQQQQLTETLRSLEIHHQTKDTSPPE